MKIKLILLGIAVGLIVLHLLVSNKVILSVPSGSVSAENVEILTKILFVAVCVLFGKKWGEGRFAFASDVLTRGQVFEVVQLIDDNFKDSDYDFASCVEVLISPLPGSYNDRIYVRFWSLEANKGFKKGFRYFWTGSIAQPVID